MTRPTKTKKTREREFSEHGAAFGSHVRSLREARGMKQDQLAEASGLSADSIRRIEAGSFSPSLETLWKLCRGLGVSLATLFEGFELGEVDARRELHDVVNRVPHEHVKLVRDLLLVLVSGLRGRR